MSINSERDNDRPPRQEEVKGIINAIEMAKSQIEKSLEGTEENQLGRFLKELDIEKYTQTSLSLHREAKKEKQALLGELQVFRKELVERGRLYQIFLESEQNKERKKIIEEIITGFNSVIEEINNFFKTGSIVHLSHLKLLIKQSLESNVLKESHIKENYERSFKKIDTYIKELITFLISEFDETNKLIDSFFSLVASDRNAFEHIISLIDHDITQLTTLKTVKETLEYLGESYAEKQLEYHFYTLEKGRKLFFYFLQSLFFISGVDKKEIERRKRDFSLSKIVDFLPQVLKGVILDSGKEVNVVIENEIPRKSRYFGLEGDIFYLLYNIVKNAKRHGDASTVKFSVKNNTLIISDNGSGIRGVDKSTLFNRGVSGGNSTGLGLRDTQERGIEIRALNKGKKNKYGKFGARFEVKIQKRK